MIILHVFINERFIKTVENIFIIIIFIENQKIYFEVIFNTNIK